MEHSVNDIGDDTLMRRAVTNCRDRNARKGQAHYRFVAVMDAFALGSTYAYQLCRRFGLDPEEKVRR